MIPFKGFLGLLKIEFERKSSFKFDFEVGWRDDIA